MLPTDKINTIVARLEEIDHRLSQPIDRETVIKLSRERAELAPVYEAVQDLKKAQSERANLEALRDDPELAALAESETEALDQRIDELTSAVRVALLPKDAADEKSAMLEIRAGTGGSEAALFAGDLFRMYARYADLHGWKVNVLSESEGEAGGYKEIIAEVAGKGVFARLKFESGVHRVQRVPVTEASGRIHTSAATVAVLPEAEDVDVDLRRALAASTPTPPIRACVSCTSRPASSSPRRRALSTRTASGPCRCCARASMISSVKGPTASAPPPGVARSAVAIDRSGSGPIIFRKDGSPTTAST